MLGVVYANDFRGFATKGNEREESTETVKKEKILDKNACQLTKSKI